MNLYLYLDMRKPHANGAGSLKIAIRHNHQTIYNPLGIYIRPDEWDAKKQQVVTRPDKKFLNVIVKKRVAEGTLALQRIMLRQDADSLTAKQILDMVVRGTDTADDPEAGEYVLPVYNEYITLLKTPGTVASYRASLNNLKEYCPDIDTLRFRDLTVAWLLKYQRWLQDTRGMSVNGSNVYFRNLRRIFNYALQNQYTLARYPFKHIDMSTTEPDKRSIEWEEFLEWVSFPLPDGRNFYRDMFMLSFYLCGMRPVDLLLAKKDQIVNGRLVYWPKKLGGRKKLSIKIEPEAWEIIRKYEGKEYLVNVMESRTDYKSFMQHWNKALRAVGPDTTYEKRVSRNRVYHCTRHNGIVSFITAYYARTFWGSFLYNDLWVPIDIISQGLGHKSGSKVTNFYVKRGEENVDRVNRALIDRLNKDLKEYKDRCAGSAS